jgi:hypothetical protein
LLLLQINRFVICQVTIDRWHQVSAPVAVKHINIARATKAWFIGRSSRVTNKSFVPIALTSE